MKPRLLFFGSTNFGLPALEAVERSGLVDVVGVVTQPARPKGRGQKLIPTVVSQWAQTHQRPVIEVATLRHQQALEQLDRLPADIYLVAAFGLILPVAVLQKPLRAAVNIHSSLLPKYRGAAPIAAALVNGEQETGVTFMVMDAGVDTGPILAQSSLYIAERETTVTLHQRLQALAAEHIASVFREWLDGRLIARPQPSTGSSLAPKITKDDGRATWDSAVLWERKIRAYAPWPGVWAFWRDRLIKLHEARAEAGRPTTPPGTIEPISQAPGWRIACADGWLIPLSVQFSDRRPQPAASVIGSYPGFVGGRLTEAVIPPAGTSQ